MTHITPQSGQSGRWRLTVTDILRSGYVIDASVGVLSATRTY